MRKKNGFDYEKLVQAALRNVVRDILTEAANNGLIDDHHFYISFATQHAAVRLPDYLLEEYPEDITIVIQHEFWDLVVDDKGFSVTLCFEDNNENLYVPFSALISFVDPSVKFGLQFAPIFPEVPKITKDSKDSVESMATFEDEVSNVVSLDFTKKKK